MTVDAASFKSRYCTIEASKADCEAYVDQCVAQMPDEDTNKQMKFTLVSPGSQLAKEGTALDCFEASRLRASMGKPASKVGSYAPKAPAPQGGAVNSVDGPVLQCGPKFYPISKFGKDGKTFDGKEDGLAMTCFASAMELMRERDTVNPVISPGSASCSEIKLVVKGKLDIPEPTRIDIAKAAAKLGMCGDVVVTLKQQQKPLFDGDIHLKETLTLASRGADGRELVGISEVKYNAKASSKQGPNWLGLVNGLEKARTGAEKVAAEGDATAIQWDGDAIPKDVEAELKNWAKAHVAGKNCHIGLSVFTLKSGKVVIKIRIESLDKKRSYNIDVPVEAKDQKVSWKSLMPALSDADEMEASAKKKPSKKDAMDEVK